MDKTALFEKNRSRLGGLVKRLKQRSERPLQTLIIPLPGQPPGEYFPEHDERMLATIDAWYEVRRWYLCQAEILLSSGTADCDGLTAAQYMKRQLEYYSQNRVWDYRVLHNSIHIGEEESGWTGRQIRSVRDVIFTKNEDIKYKYDFIILVSNTPHLWPAGSYFKHLYPDMPFVKWSSGNGRGCLNLPYSRYLLRETLHYLATLTFDRKGYFLDEDSIKKSAEWSKLRFPPIPYYLT